MVDQASSRSMSSNRLYFVNRLLGDSDPSTAHRHYPKKSLQISEQVKLTLEGNGQFSQISSSTDTIAKQSNSGCSVPTLISASSPLITNHFWGCLPRAPPSLLGKLLGYVVKPSPTFGDHVVGRPDLLF
jgi:hypothetical protein